MTATDNNPYTAGHPAFDRLVEGLVDSVMVAMAERGFSLRTQQSYQVWVRRFLIASGQERLEALTETDVVNFMIGIAHSGRYKRATLAQAANAIRFLFRAMFDACPDWLEDATDVERRVAPPMTVSGQQAAQVIAHLSGGHRVMAWLAYGAGLRLMEIVTLRLGDVDEQNRHVHIVNEDGSFRVNPLPKLMMPTLKAHLEWVKSQHELDRCAGYGYVALPGANGNTLRFSSEQSAQFVFPSTQLTHDDTTGHVGRSHVSAKGLQRAIMQAGRKAGITRQVTANVLRGTFAAEKLAAGSDPNHVQTLMGHKTRTATLRYAKADSLKIETRTPLA